MDLRHVLDVLDVERIEQDLFRGKHAGTDVQRVFGGQVSAQALVAAARTVTPLQMVHSLHAYFIRPGDPGAPVVYRVERLRDGRRFSTRRVAAIQQGRAILSFTASFTSEEGAILHQDEMPAVAPPEDVPALPDRTSVQAGGDSSGVWTRRHVFDLRYVGDPLRAAPATAPPRRARNQVWVRADGPLPDDPVVNACLLTYASDLTLLDLVLLRYQAAHDGVPPRVVSLDHSIWFHRPARLDDWLLFDQGSSTVAGQRGLAASRVFSRRGELVATVMQEGLLETE